MLRILSSIFIFALLFSSALADNYDFSKKSDRYWINLYGQELKSFSKKVCRGADRTYQKLFQSYKGEGFYIPVKRDGTLDKETINKHLPNIKQKLNWIGLEIKKLKKRKHFKGTLGIVTRIQGFVDKILRYKNKMVLEPKKAQHYRAKERELFNLIGLEFHNLVYDRVSFMTNYIFPVDFFALRAMYDQYKDVDTGHGKKQTRSFYFFRRLVEDGTTKKNGRKSDKFLRAALSTVALRLTSHSKDFNELLRSDLEYVLDELTRYLKAGPQNMLKRLYHWKKRTEESLTFYKSLLGKNKANKKKVKRLLSKHAKATAAIKKFTNGKKAESYIYWANKRNELGLLYALETILFEEVGGLYDPFGEERKDVLRVVLNRLNKPEFATIGKDEELYPMIFSKIKNRINTNKWLNVLFKKGEFSFTYYYITGITGVFCPSRTRASKKLRLRNLRLILDILRGKRDSYPAIRYFSRKSMIGRIQMDQIWKDYKPIEEKPGPKLKKVGRLLTKIKKGQYRFIYAFSGGKYWVVEISDKKYVYQPSNKSFFFYRNPHVFKFFYQKNN